MNEVTYNWQRFWHPRGVAPMLSDSGFLPDPESDWGAKLNPSLVTLDAISSTPCLILLGEPGMGKSHVLGTDRRSNTIHTHSSSEMALPVDLGSVGSDQALMREVFDAPEFRVWADADGADPPRLCLYLDSLDECLATVTTVAKTLLHQFPQYPICRLSLQLVCRTATWSRSLGFLEDGLRKIWGEDSVRVMELAPLRRVDVFRAAEHNGIADPDTFVRAVVRTGAQAFAVKPVTLNLLLRIYKDEGNFPVSLNEIYKRGCQLLCEETNQGRQGLRVLSVDQRLAVAARIAAVTIFANRYAVFTRPDQGDLEESDVAFASLLGGHETDLRGAQFRLDAKALDEALDTGLFTARGQGRMGWAHQTYAEYLAAWYVADLHRMSGSRLLSLLAHPDAPDRRLVPQLNSAAAWVASRSLEVLRHVVETDPDVLLKGDASDLDNATKVRLIDRLLSMLADNTLSVHDLPVGDNLRRLDHPGLPEQLRRFLTNKADAVTSRYAAIKIGEGCARRELQDEWVRIALDQTEPLSLRIQAAYTVSRGADVATRGRMLPLAQMQAGDDPEDELRGCALKAVWPDHISGSELLALLTPQKGRLMGAYWGFLRTLDLTKLSDADLPDAVSWAAGLRIPEDYLDSLGSLDSLAHVVLIVLGEAFDRMEAPGVLPALAEAAFARVLAYEPIFGADIYGRVTALDFADPKRHALVEALVSHAAQASSSGISSGNKAIYCISLQRGSIFHEDDLPWLLDRLRATPPSSPLAVAYAHLIRLLYGPCLDDPESFNLIYSEAQESLELAQEYGSFFNAVAIGSEEAQRMREFYAQELQRNKRPERLLLDPSPQKRILDYLTDFEAGDTGAWMRLCSTLQLEPDSEYYQNNMEPDITYLPGWKVADATLRARLVDVAQAYLYRHQPGNSDWIGTNRLTFEAVAGYRAFSLLLLERPAILSELPASVWQSWSTVVLAFPIAKSSSNWECHRDLVTRAYNAAPDAVISTLMRLIDCAQGHSLIDLELCHNCLDERLSVALLARVKQTRFAPHVMVAILRGLMRHGQGDTPQVAQGLTELLLREVVSSSDENISSEACIVAMALLNDAPSLAWDVIWTAVQNNPGFGRSLFETLSYQDRQDAFIPSGLTEGQLADLYLWIAAEYPHVEDPKIEGGHMIGPREDIANWRDDLLNHLVGRGTTEACKAVEYISIALPHLIWIPRMVRQAQDAMRRATWKPPTPEQVIRLAMDSNKRLVRSEEELLSVVVESLGRFQERLHDETPAVFDVWGEIPGKAPTVSNDNDSETALVQTASAPKKSRKKPLPKVYAPMGENHLSNRVKRHLEDDLKGRNILLGREVEIRPGTDGGAAGEITDIHVVAFTADFPKHDGDSGDVVKVIIETKGAWNKDLFTSMDEQLAGRYLRENKCRHGIYLVGWYKCSQWNSGDWRKGKHIGGTLTDLRSRLDLQAVDVSVRHTINIVAVVLDVSLREKQ